MRAQELPEDNLEEAADQLTQMIAGSILMDDYDLNSRTL